jgi:hypothetical protein
VSGGAVSEGGVSEGGGSVEGGEFDGEEVEDGRAAGTTAEGKPGGGAVSVGTAAGSWTRGAGFVAFTPTLAVEGPLAAGAAGADTADWECEDGETGAAC